MSAYQHIFQGAGAPASAPGSVSAHYVDTQAGELYLAKGTASAADWVKVGKAIASTAINETGNLIVTFSDDSTADLGLVKGDAGLDGSDGLGITGAVIDEAGHLQITYSDASVVDAGSVVPEAAGDTLTADAPAVRQRPGVVAASDYASVEVGFSASVTIPAATQVGDLLVAIMSHYHNITDGATGWTKVNTTDTMAVSYWYQVSTSVYVKVATAEDIGATKTFTQFDDGQFWLQILAVRGDAPLAVVNHAITSEQGSADNVVEMASLSTTHALQCVLAAAYSSFNHTTGPYTVSDGWEQTTPTSALDPAKLAIAHRRYPSGATAGGAFTDAEHEGGATNQDRASITVLIGYAI